MAAARKDITVERDASLSLHFFMQNSSDQSPFNLTGYSIEGQIRETPGAKHVLADLACTIVLPATNGEITVELDDAGSLTISPGVYSWDLFIRNSGQSVRLLYGTATVVDTVSR